MLSSFVHTLRKVYLKARVIFLRDNGAREILRWAKDGGERLRFVYTLNERSTVFDMGAYEGQWTSDIFSRYCCNMYCFEPVKEFAKQLNERFACNNKIRIYQYGLSNEDKTVSIALARNSSSAYKLSEKTPREEIILKNAVNFMKEFKIETIDLMKINIEGGEYDLLEHLVDSGFISNIKNIQVQFHDFVPQAEERMRRLQERLMKTHHLTYQYLFVWENWELNNV